MARVDDLIPFCEKHGLVLTSIADLIEYIKEGGNWTGKRSYVARELLGKKDMRPRRAGSYSSLTKAAHSADASILIFIYIDIHIHWYHIDIDIHIVIFDIDIIDIHIDVTQRVILASRYRTYTRIPILDKVKDTVSIFHIDIELE